MNKLWCKLLTCKGKIKQIAVKGWNEWNFSVVDNMISPTVWIKKAKHFLSDCWLIYCIECNRWINLCRWQRRGGMLRGSPVKNAWPVSRPERMLGWPRLRREKPHCKNLWLESINKLVTCREHFFQLPDSGERITYHHFHLKLTLNCMYACVSVCVHLIK